MAFRRFDIFVNGISIKLHTSQHTESVKGFPHTYTCNKRGKSQHASKKNFNPMATAKANNSGQTVNKR